MAFQNAFDIGACTVVVWGSDVVNPLWSGALTKGQSSPVFNGNSGDQFQVSVTSDGAVQLIETNSGAGQGYAVGVIPSYSNVGPQIQVAGITLAQGISGAAAYISETVGTTIPLSGSASSWTPDPANITSTYASGGTDYGWYVFEGRGT